MGKLVDYIRRFAGREPVIVPRCAMCAMATPVGTECNCSQADRDYCKSMTIEWLQKHPIDSHCATRLSSLGVCSFDELGRISVGDMRRWNLDYVEPCVRAAAAELLTRYKGSTFDTPLDLERLKATIDEGSPFDG